jgi:hypothetical protein
MSDYSSGDADAAQASGASNPVWADISPYFTQTDIQSMDAQSRNWAPGAPQYGPLDLSDYASVKAHAQMIVQAVVVDQSMPCLNSGESWTQAMMDNLQTWVTNGCPQT